MQEGTGGIDFSNILTTVFKIHHPAINIKLSRYLMLSAMNYSEYGGYLTGCLSSDQTCFKRSVPMCGWGHFPGPFRLSSFNFQGQEHSSLWGWASCCALLTPPFSFRGAGGSTQVLSAASPSYSSPRWGRVDVTSATAVSLGCCTFGEGLM